MGAILALTLFGVLQARAQESNQAALIHVEKGSQEHLLFPKAVSVPVASHPAAEQPPRSTGNFQHDVQEKRPVGNPLDMARTRLTIAWGYYNQARYQDAARLFEELTREEALKSVTEEARLGLAYSLIRLNRLSDAADLLEDLVTQGIRLEETAPALVETLLTLKRYQDAEKYLPLLR
ncbi:MAG: tetratricopeptide repeat protein [Desulfosoma sp.]